MFFVKFENNNSIEEKQYLFLDDLLIDLSSRNTGSVLVFGFIENEIRMFFDCQSIRKVNQMLIGQ